MWTNVLKVATLLILITALILTSFRRPSLYRWNSLQTEVERAHSGLRGASLHDGGNWTQEKTDLKMRLDDMMMQFEKQTRTAVVLREALEQRRQRLIASEGKMPSNFSWAIDTPGCKLPLFDPWDTIMGMKPLTVNDTWGCTTKPSLIGVRPTAVPYEWEAFVDIETFETNYKTATMDNVDELHCEAKEMRRERDSKPVEHSVQNVTRNETAKLNFPVAKLECRFNDTQVFAQTRLFFIPKSDEELANSADSLLDTRNLTTLDVEHRQELLKRLGKPLDSPAKLGLDVPKYNVLMVMFDSVSQLTGQRFLVNSSRIFTEEMGAEWVFGHHRIGFNTYPNMMGMLTGLLDEEIGYPYKMEFDPIRFVWSEFADRGYRTLLLEEEPHLNFGRIGFFKEPTTYYFSQYRNPSTLEGCNWNKINAAVLFDYTKYFVEFHHDRDIPFFASVTTCSLTHGNTRALGFIDDDLANLLRFLVDKNVTDNTIVMLYGDHGFRFGWEARTFIGHVETSMPLMGIALPRTFRERHSGLVEVFKKNMRRLTTHYDIYRFLREIADFHDPPLPNDPVDFALQNFERWNQTLQAIDVRKNAIGPQLLPPVGRYTRSMSLFHPIPQNRTCEDANVLSQFCRCFDKILLENPPTFAVVAAEAVVDYINDEVLKKVKNLCEMVKLEKVTKMYAYVTNEEMTQFVSQLPPLGTSRKYMIEFRAQPYDMTYEAVVTMDGNQETFKVETPIVRTSKYGDTAHCITDDKKKLRNFCYCKQQLCRKSR